MNLKDNGPMMDNFVEQLLQVRGANKNSHTAEGANKRAVGVGPYGSSPAPPLFGDIGATHAHDPP